MDLKGKTILVTGADGFIGSHLVEALLEKGCNVRALSFYNSFNFWGWLEDIPPHTNLEVVNGDIRDPHYVRKIAMGTDLIFNLAALIAIPYSYIAPDSYVDTNIKGILNVCQAAIDHGGIPVIHTSTSEVYGTGRQVPIAESHPKQPQSPYSATKIGADAMAMSFYHAFGLPVTIARPFNTYGPRQSARAIIPTIITQIGSGMKQIKLGDVRPTRDLNYVKDTCAGFIALAECDQTAGKEINISSNYEISMLEVFRLIREILNAECEVITDESRLRPENSEVFRLWGDNSLIKALTGWQPEHDIRQGLELTCKWFEKPENLAKYKPGIYNL